MKWSKTKNQNNKNSQPTRPPFCLMLVKGDNPTIFLLSSCKVPVRMTFSFLSRFILTWIQYLISEFFVKKKTPSNVGFVPQKMHFRIAWKNKIFYFFFFWGFIEFLSTSSRGFNFCLTGLCIWRNSQTEKSPINSVRIGPCSLNFTL